jgi:dTDP-4-dehydrorhamnose reductase
LTPVRSVLVTGASGYLGSELARRAPARGAELTGTYRSREPTEPLAGGAHRVDVRDTEAVCGVLAEARPHAVINAAYVQAGPDAWSVTADGAEVVARACAEAGVRLIQMSTDVMFDRDGGPPLREEDEPNPVTDYGQAKAEAERRVRAALPEALIVRTSLIYGGPEPSNHERTALEVADGKREMVLFTDELRSPVQVGDLAEALLELAALEVSGPLHVAGADVVSRHDFACLVARANGRRTDRIAAGTIAEAGLARPRNCALDSSRARQLLRARLRGAHEVLSAGSGPRSA